MFRPRLIVSSKVFQVVFVHLVYNTALFWASCCCSFSLHAVANLICIFLVPRQLVLLLILPKFLHSFCDQKVCIPQFFWKISSRLMSIVFYPFAWGSKFRFHVEECGEYSDQNCVCISYSSHARHIPARLVLIYVIAVIAGLTVKK